MQQLSNEDKINPKKKIKLTILDSSKLQQKEVPKKIKLKILDPNELDQVPQKRKIKLGILDSNELEQKEVPKKKIKLKIVDPNELEQKEIQQKKVKIEEPKNSQILPITSEKIDQENVKKKGHALEVWKNVEKTYKDNGCILLSTEKDYKNYHSILKFKCSCGNPECEKKYINFKRYPRCNSKEYNCKSPNLKKLEEEKYQEVKKIFAKHGCELISKKYINNSSKLDFKCYCNNIDKKTLEVFRNTPHCSNCKGESIEEMENKYINNGCILLEKISSINRTLKYEFVCICKEIDKKLYKDFENSPQCSKCDYLDKLETVENIYKSKGCVLLTEKLVENKTKIINKTELEYICSCGNEWKKRFEYFRESYRCDKCVALIRKETGEKRKISFEEYENLLTSKGFKSNIMKNEYEGASKCYPAICPNNHDCEVRYSYIKAGESCCVKCGVMKRFETCLNLYGGRAPMADKEIARRALKKRSETWMGKYGTSHPMQNNKVKQKQKETFEKNYGGHPMKTEKVQEKRRQTCKKVYGVPFPSQTDKVKEKSRQTCQRKWGVDHYSQTEEFEKRRRETCMEKYGTHYALQSEEVKEKGRQTCQRKWGVDHHMKVPEIFDKVMRSSHRMKEYIFPSGKKTWHQGYENFCLDELIEVYEETQILNLSTDVPLIDYHFEGSEHKYIPDIYIPDDNLIIEVKSVFTMEKEEEKNYAKAEACLELGYNFEFRIYNYKGERIETITF